MTAVPGDARLTDAEKDWLREITDTVTGGLWTQEHDPLLFAVVEAILRDRLPEATTVTERGVEVNEASEIQGPIDNWQGYQRGELRATHQRTHTRYADHYGPWTEVTE